MRNDITNKFNDNIEEIKKLRLEDKMLIKDIAKIFGFNKGTLTNLLLKNNIVLVQENRFTDEFKEEIVRMYNEGLGMHKISKIVHTEHQKVKDILIEKGIRIRTASELSRKYTLNEHYFDEISTQDKAYLLGFLFADGYNCEENNTISLSLQEQDKDVLDKMCKALDYNNTPKLSTFNHNKNPNWSKVYRLSFHSKHTSEVLAKLGVIQNKSLKITFPEYLDESLYSHFIRGYFDGDGCFYCHEKCIGNDEVNLVGTEQFCTKLLNILHENNVITGGSISVPRNDNGITRVIRFGGANQTRAFLDWIYKDANLYLDRKHQKYINRYYQNINNTLSA